MSYYENLKYYTALVDLFIMNENEEVCQSRAQSTSVPLGWDIAAPDIWTK